MAREGRRSREGGEENGMTAEKKKFRFGEERGKRNNHPPGGDMLKRNQRLRRRKLASGGTKRVWAETLRGKTKGEGFIGQRKKNGGKSKMRLVKLGWQGGMKK